MPVSLKFYTPILLFVLILLSNCKTGKEIVQNPLSYDELYKVWRVDSLVMTGRSVPNGQFNESTVKFTKAGKIVTFVNGQRKESSFELKDNSLINLDEPGQSVQIIDKLNKEQLTLKSLVQNEELRLFLSPK